MARAARYIPDPITGSFRMRESVAEFTTSTCESSPGLMHQAQSAVNLRNHPDEFAVRYARRQPLRPSSRMLANR